VCQNNWNGESTIGEGTVHTTHYSWCTHRTKNQWRWLSSWKLNGNEMLLNVNWVKAPKFFPFWSTWFFLLIPSVCVLVPTCSWKFLWDCYIPNSPNSWCPKKTALIPGYAGKNWVAWCWIVSTNTRVHVQTYAYSHKTTTSIHVLSILMPLSPPLCWLGVANALSPASATSPQ
jgi:hypothetical protein